MQSTHLWQKTHRDMSGKVFVVFALLVVLLVSSAASSSSASSPVNAEETNILQQLMAKHETARDAAVRQKPRIQGARVARRAQLSEDEREIMAKQIVQAVSEMVNSECLSDRDYQGWLDFGRRDAE